MATVHDVAAYILKKRGKMSAMKLQKLVYYCQAWSLVWEDVPLFSDDIQAWSNGPVVPTLYAEHKGKFDVSNWPSGNPAHLSNSEAETIDIVLKSYSPFNAQELSDMTHREMPWQLARKNVQEGERGSNIITLESMMEYYSSLLTEQ